MDPSPRLCRPPGPSPSKVCTGQREGLSDCVMATSVSTGQMVFPGVSELMAPQPAGRELLLSGALYLPGNIRAAWPQAVGTQRTAALPTALN